VEDGDILILNNTPDIGATGPGEDQRSF